MLKEGSEYFFKVVKLMGAKRLSMVGILMRFPKLVIFREMGLGPSSYKGNLEATYR